MPIPPITQGKDYNYFTRFTVSNATFNPTSDVDFTFRGPLSFSLINEGTGTIEYSFNGNTLHGDMVPNTSSASLVFTNRGVNHIWFRLKTGSASAIRIEACAGTIAIK